MENFLNHLIKNLRLPSLCRLWQSFKSCSWTTLARQPDIRTPNLIMQPCVKVISPCYPPCFKPYMPSFARKLFWIVAIQTRGRRILLNTAADDGSRRLAFMHFFARSLCSPHCILYCAGQLHRFCEMRHFNSLGIILGVFLQLKPAYTEFYSSRPASNESSMQSLETRQGSTVVVPSEFLRRGFHGC